jgi:hypothetical protein
MSPITNPREEDLIGQTFTQDHEHFIITGARNHNGIDFIDYTNTDTKEEHYSTRAEVVRWVKQSKVRQLANNIQPSRRGFMNTLAELMFKELHPPKYDVKLVSNKVTPPKVTKKHKDVNNNGLKRFEKKEMACCVSIPGLT